MVVLVDSREAEKHPEFIEGLILLGSKPEVVSLEVGDFQVGGKRGSSVIERKTSVDFIHSIASRRLWEQMAKLATCENPRLIIEGSLGVIKKWSKFSDASMVGALVSVLESWGIGIYPTYGKRNTILLVHVLDNFYEGGKKRKMTPIRPKPMALTPQQWARGVLEGFPMIGPSKADKILRYFGSLAEFGRRYQEVDKVEGVGEKMKKAIVEVMEAKYGGN